MVVVRFAVFECGQVHSGGIARTHGSTSEKFYGRYTPTSGKFYPFFRARRSDEKDAGYLIRVSRELRGSCVVGQEDESCGEQMRLSSLY